MLLLCGRCRCGLRIGGLGRIVLLIESLDLRFGAQLRDIVRLRLADDEGLELRLHLLEGRCLAGALVLDLDDVPAELRLHGVGNLAGLECESGGREFRHHLVLGEVAEVAAVRGARVLGFLLRKLGEVRALLQLGDDRLRLILGLDQNVTGVNFLLAGDLLRGFLIDLLQGLVGQGGLALVIEQGVHQETVAAEGEAALEIGAVGDFLVLSGLGDDFQVDQEPDDTVLAGGRVELREARAKVLFRGGDVALPDLGPVNLGDDLVVVGAQRGSHQGQREAAGGAGEEAQHTAGAHGRRRTGRKGHGLSFSGQKRR